MRRGGQVPRHLHCTLRGEKEQGGGGPGSRRGGWLLACLLVPREKPDRLERVNQINLPPVRPRATSPFNNIASLFRLVSAERVVVIKSQFPRRRFSRASLGRTVWVGDARKQAAATRRLHPPEHTRSGGRGPVQSPLSLPPPPASRIQVPVCPPDQGLNRARIPPLGMWGETMGLYLASYSTQARVCMHMHMYRS